MIQRLRVVQRCIERALVLALRNFSLPRVPNTGTGFLQAWKMSQTYQCLRAMWIMILIICFYFLSAPNWSGSWIIVGLSQLKYSILFNYIWV